MNTEVELCTFSPCQLLQRPGPFSPISPPSFLDNYLNLNLVFIHNWHFSKARNRVNTSLTVLRIWKWFHCLTEQKILLDIPGAHGIHRHVVYTRVCHSLIMQFVLGHLSFLISCFSFGSERSAWWHCIASVLLQTICWPREYGDPFYPYCIVKAFQKGWNKLLILRFWPYHFTIND